MNRQSLILIASCAVLAAWSIGTSAPESRDVVRTMPLQQPLVDGSGIEFVLVEDEAYSPPVLLLEM